MLLRPNLNYKYLPIYRYAANNVVRIPSMSIDDEISIGKYKYIFHYHFQHWHFVYTPTMSKCHELSIAGIVCKVCIETILCPTLDKKWTKT